MSEARRSSGDSRSGGARLSAALVGASSLLVVFCFASELQLFSWKLEIRPDIVQLHQPGVYSADLRREPFGIPFFRFMPGDAEGLRPYHLKTREGFTLQQNGVELGPAHVAPDNLSLGGGRFVYLGRVLYFTPSDGADPRTSGDYFTVIAPVVVDWPLAIACIVVWLLCIARLSRDAPNRAGERFRGETSGVCGPTTRAFLRWRGDDLAVLILSVAVAGIYALNHPELSIPHGPLAAGVGIQDARMWDDAALVLASGSGYSMAHRPGYPLLLGASYALFGVSNHLPLILNLLAYAGTGLLVYRSAIALFGRAAAVGAVLLLYSDILRLGYVQVSNTDIIGCFLTACFVYTAIALFCGRDRSLALWLVVGLLLGLANLVKTMTLPAIVIVVAGVAASKRISGLTRKSVVIALVVAGLLIPLVPWNAYRQQLQGASELGEKGATALFLATSPEINIDGNVDRTRSRELRERGFGGADLTETVIANLKEHWLAYFRNVALALHKSFDTLHFGGHGSVLAVLVGFLLVMAPRWNLCPDRRAIWILGSGGALAIFIWSLLEIGIWLPVTIVAVFAIGRRDLLLFLCLASIPLLVTSMLGMGGYDRQLIAVTWVFPIVTIGSLALITNRFGEWLAARGSGATGEAHALDQAIRSDPQIDWSSLGIVAGFVVLSAIGIMKIQMGGPGDGILGEEFTMTGRELWALPTSEHERRGRDGAIEAKIACPQARLDLLLRDARRVLETVPRRSGPRRRLICFRAYTGRHMVRVRESQRGIWNRHRPFIFDRAYERTILRDSSFIRISGWLPDSWRNRVVHVVGVMGRNDVVNAVILEDAEPSELDVSRRDRIIVSDRRHLSATRNGI